MPLLRFLFNSAHLHFQLEHRNIIVVMDSPKRQDSWAIATYLRVKPTFQAKHKDIDYHIQDVRISDGDSRSIIDLVIPPDADPGLIHNNSATGRLKFEFDRVFNSETTQEDLYDIVVKEKILGLLDGFSCTVFAYGQTGSGKTYTIFGGESFAERGLIPRSLGTLFSELKIKKQKIPSFGFKCQVSFTEIYKETVYDLLEQNRTSLIREEWTPVQLLDSANGLVLKNLSVYDVETEEEALQLFFMGNNTRITTATSMNSVSSRSHAVFTLLLESEGIKIDQTIFTSSKINLVDLAGSERMYKMTNTKGMIKEAKSINLSLHFLEQVIISLRDQTLQKKNHPNKSIPVDSSNSSSNKHNGSSSSNGSNNFIPYRNSVLTNMLRDSLGGNCRSCFILTISPEILHFEETVSTCRFGQRCGEIKVEVAANSEVGLSDQLKVLNIKLRNFEKQLLNTEDEKKRLLIELNKERELRIRQTQSRILTVQEQLICKTCVQDLLSVAKESILIKSSTVGTASEEDGRLRSEELIENSHNKLYDSIELMDKSVLVELCTALGGLVQSMFIERETTKQKLIYEEKQRHLAMEEAIAKENQNKHEAEQIRNGNFNQLEYTGVLPDILKQIVLKGAIFIKYNRLGMKDVRSVAVSEDLMHLTWRPVGLAKGSVDRDQGGAHPLRFFESVEHDGVNPARLQLRGRPGQKHVLLEFADAASDSDNARGAQQWAAALRFLIKNAAAS